jgi:hypothetical protein
VSDPRYAIGIDLGTTHCALSYVDSAASDGEKIAQQVLPIAQLTAPGALESRDLLPSFLYLPHESELTPGDLTLPWTAPRNFAVGEMARTRGAGTPIRLVSSAKSWLATRASIAARRSCRTMRRPKSRACRRWKARPLPHASARSVGPRASGRAVRRSGRDGHDPRVVRPGRARADGRGRARGRLRG